MSSPFSTVHHVCIVAHDLLATIQYLESLGIGPWHDYPHSSPYVELEVPDPLGSSESQVKCTQLDNIELQVCQPSMRPTPERLFLDQRGEGVYHLGFAVKDLDQAENTGQQLGLGVIARGRRADRTGFCYFDTRERAGVVLEVRASAADSPEVTHDGPQHSSLPDQGVQR